MISPKIAIVGSGAVGGYYGARLAQHGHQVHFLLRSDFQAVQQHGWTIQSCDGDFILPANKVNAYEDPAKMPKVDLVIVTLKSTANHQFASLIGPLLNEDTVILTLQNGLGNEESLAELFGVTRVLGGLAFTCINRTGPGQISHTDHGLIRLGEFDGGPSPRANSIAELFNASGIHCQVLDDLRYGRWDKLVWNVPFNGLGAAMDLTTDKLLANPAGRSLVRQIMEEIVLTAAAIGIRLPNNIIDQKIEQTRSMGAYHTSMQIDRQQRRPLEIQAIVGLPLGIAEKYSIKTPFLQVLKDMLTTLSEVT
jgi:2-dehydropantoate 2-reductase